MPEDDQGAFVPVVFVDAAGVPVAGATAATPGVRGVGSPPPAPGWRHVEGAGWIAPPLRHFVDAHGVFVESLETFEGHPEGLAEARTPPPNAVVRWDGDAWRAARPRYAVAAGSGVFLARSVSSFEEPPAGEVWVDLAPPHVNVTWDFSAGAWIDHGKPPPAVVTKLGLKRAFGSDWPGVRAALQAHDDMREEWDLAIEIARADPMVAALGEVLGLSGPEIDRIFEEAARVAG